MRRRNLMIGLGVLATGSGATALTGATLQNTVSPTADFRVNVEAADLIVRKNSKSSFNGDPINTNTEDIPDDTLGYQNDVSDLNSAADFTAAANDELNGKLEFGVVIPFDQIPTSGNETDVSGTQTYRFPNLLEVQNNNQSESANVVVRYDNASGGSPATNYGYVTEAEDDIDGDGSFVTDNGAGTNELSYDEVAYLFDINVETSTDAFEQISPVGATSDSSSNQKPDKAAELSPNSIADISVTANFTDSIGQKIVDEIKSQGIDGSGGQIRLLKEVWFSDANNPGNDTVNGPVTPVDPNA